MFRIGILGSDNSHAKEFASVCNLPDENGKYYFDDARVVAIYGNDDDPVHTKAVAEECKIDFIANAPSDFEGKVDAVMVVYRDGGQHIRDILPFIKKGMPVWIDKPIAFTKEDVDALLSAMKETGNNLVCGGSTLKLSPDTLGVKAETEKESFGKLIGGAVTYHANFEAKYNGIYFYGSHAVEIALKIFGYDVQSVQVIGIKSDNTTVSVKYADKLVTLVLNGFSAKDYILAVGDKDCAMQQISVPFKELCRLGITEFVEMLRTRTCPISPEKLVKPVYMLNAIDLSYRENREVKLCEVQ